MEYLVFLLGQKYFVLFLILALGIWLGRFKIKNISLGSTLVLLVALIFGHVCQNVVPSAVLRGVPEPTVKAIETQLKLTPKADAKDVASNAMKLAAQSGETLTAPITKAEVKKVKSAEGVTQIIELEDLKTVGLLIFLYAVGLQAGPAFVRTFKRSGLKFLTITAVSVFSAMAVAVIAAIIMKLPPDIATGLFCGAMTNTPALGAAKPVLDALPNAAAWGIKSGNAVAGYALAYPFSMVGTVLLIQLLPKLLRKDFKKEEQSWDVERRAGKGHLGRRSFKVTNTMVDGKTITQINPDRHIHVNISRVKRGDEVYSATADFIIKTGDVLLAVGETSELEKMGMLVGEECDPKWDTNPNVISVDVDLLSLKYANKTLADLDLFNRFGVTVTRIRRQGVELTPSGSSELLHNDNLRIVGDREHVVEVTKRLEGGSHTAEETSFLPFLVGLLIGVFIGVQQFSIAGSTITLSTAGGAFLISLIFGYYGKVGPWHLHVPTAAANFCKEFGLMLFLAGAGLDGGAKFADVFAKYGWSLVGAGAAVTTVCWIFSLFFMLVIFRMRWLSSSGALSACLTNPPALGASITQTRSELPVLGWSSVYPIATILKVVFVQLLVPLLYNLVAFAAKVGAK